MLACSSDEFPPFEDGNVDLSKGTPSASLWAVRPTLLLEFLPLEDQLCLHTLLMVGTPTQRWQHEPPTSSQANSSARISPTRRPTKFARSANRFHPHSETATRTCLRAPPQLAYKQSGQLCHWDFSHSKTNWVCLSTDGFHPHSEATNPIWLQVLLSLRTLPISSLRWSNYHNLEMIVTQLRR